ncbi:MAG: hypothetical protein HKN22_08680, partial [Bacteroidia bacterium]|nr:hypothetical protein [Bacteroidia bacterium]
MKNLAYFLFNFFFLTHFAFTGDVVAQSEEDNEKVTVTITKNVNGEESVQTMTYDFSDFNMDKILEKIDMDMEKLEQSLDVLGEKLQEIDVDVDIQGLDQMVNAFGVDDDGKEKKVIRIKHAHKSDKGFLGVVPEKHENGVLIKEVVKGSGAEAAGIKT